MTLFIVLAIVMAAVAIGLIVRPLLRKPADAPADVVSRPSRAGAVVTAIALPVLAAFLYVTVSNQQWDYVPGEGGEGGPEIEHMVAQLEERLKAEPGDAEGWVMLGRSFVMLGRYPRAVEAYQQAYDLTRGENLPAITGLAEALILTDEASLNGRAGELIESALTKAPGEPKALWYGSLSALSAGRLDVARDRMQALLAQNPPDEVRSVLESQIAEINAQLGSPAAQSAAAVVSVSVSLAPDIAAQIREPLTLFVLARNAAGGPPLAVVRLRSDELPTTVELSDGNAMLAGQGISSVPSAQIVARLSHSGSPQATSGDFFGEANYAVQPGRGSVNIVIDRVVP